MWCSLKFKEGSVLEHEIALGTFVIEIHFACASTSNSTITLACDKSRMN